jgi:hypothetical protein
VSHSGFEGNQIVDALDVWGGAIGSRGSQIVISHSWFSDNQADGHDGRARGGAVMSTTGGSLDVDNSRFTGNSALGSIAQGGAIAAFQAVTSTISNSQFVGNSAVGDTAQGGAIWNFRGFGRSMTIDHSAIVGHRVIGESLAEGGGVYNGTDFGPPPSLTLTQTNVNANQATGVGENSVGVGGGIFNTGLVNVDVASNVHGNKASTSHDDVFGDLTLLEELLSPI